MYYPKFIPPKDDDHDFNPEIDRMIEDELELRFRDPEEDIRDFYEENNPVKSIDADNLPESCKQIVSIIKSKQTL